MPCETLSFGGLGADSGDGEGVGAAVCAGEGDGDGVGDCATTVAAKAQRSAITGNMSLGFIFLVLLRTILKQTSNPVNGIFITWYLIGFGLI